MLGPLNALKVIEFRMFSSACPSWLQTQDQARIQGIEKIIPPLQSTHLSCLFFSGLNAYPATEILD